MFSDFLSNLNFWGWQLIIVAAAISLPLGYSTSKEYAELEWPIDIAIALIWVAFGINMIGTILKRREASFICCDLVLHCHIRHCSSFAYF